MSILNLLASNGFITVNKQIMRELGLEEAVLLGELCSEYVYWESQNKLTDDNMFFCSVNKLEENTGLSDRKQRRIIKRLEELEILETQLKGLPATRYFKINVEQLFLICKMSSFKMQDEFFQNARSYLSKCKGSNNINNKNKKERIEKREKESQKPKNTSLLKTTSSIADKVVDMYHEHCPSLPKIRVITDKRKQAIQKICKLYNLETIKEVFDLIEKSDFCKGKNDRGWIADLDFILREDKFANILEGKYNNKSKVNKKSKFENIDEPIKRLTAEEKQKVKEDIKNGKAKMY